MKPAYRDIRDRIAEAPAWFDEAGAPRYGSFDPSALGVYDQLAILAEVACQCCDETFQVGIGRPGYLFDGAGLVELDLAGLAESWDYGDPPRHDLPGRPGWRCAGETMGSIQLSVVEAWERDDDGDWSRRPALQGSVR